MSSGEATAHVRVTRRSMRSLRVRAAAPRALLAFVVVVGVAATIRNSIAPPTRIRVEHRLGDARDPAAEGVAALFARRYLSWNAAAPQSHQRGLTPFLASGVDADAGMRLPTSGAQSVAWTQVEQAHDRSPTDHVYTVAAQTDRSGLVYLSVEVARGSDGRLGLTRLPALVGAPATQPADLEPDAHLRDVADQELTAVVSRALGNYLGAAATNLGADLTDGARVSLPGLHLGLEQVQQLKWSVDGQSVMAVVRAAAGDGTEYTLDYELDVMRAGTRWLVAAIQADPSA